MVTIQAIRAWAEWERQQIRFEQVFGAIAPTRKERKRIDSLARRLLVHHIERGMTLADIRDVVEKGLPLDVFLLFRHYKWGRTRCFEKTPE